MNWLTLNSETFKSRTFWIAISCAVFNVAAPALGVSPEIIGLVNMIFGSTGAVTLRDAISKKG